jgi:hypothetical protein
VHHLGDITADFTNTHALSTCEGGLDSMTRLTVTT